MSGPIPKSYEENKKNGFPGKRGKADRKSMDISIATAEPNMPAWLDSGAKEHWQEIVPLLIAYRLCTVLDGPALGAMCSKYSQAVKAERVLNKKGTGGGATFLSPNGHICQRPEVKIAKDAWSAYYQCAEKFGMTPASRARMRIPLPKSSASDQPTNRSRFFGPGV